MRLVIQRVLESSVRIDGQVVGQIGRGYMVLCGVEDGDTQDDLRYCIDKTVNLRIFEDDAGKMNRSILDVGGAVLDGTFQTAVRNRKKRKNVEDAT